MPEKIFNLRKCLSCGESLSGRLDKKFCDDHCRSAFNNQNKRFHEKVISETNRILRRNQTILKSLCPQGKATIRKEVLLEMGFDFSVFTTLFPTGKGVYYLSYEYGYMPIIEKSGLERRPIQKVLIIQKQAYMKSRFDPWKYTK